MENPFEAISDKLEMIERYLRAQPRVEAPVEYMQVDAAASFLSISPNALRVLVHRNMVPHIKKLGKNYFLKADLISWMEEGRVSTEEEIISLAPTKRKARRSNAA